MLLPQILPTDANGLPPAQNEINLTSSIFDTAHYI